MAVWMYGDPTTLNSGPVDIGRQDVIDKYNEYVRQGASADRIGLSDKLLRATVFPIAVILFAILLFKIVTNVVAAPALAIVK
jgi:hypothetical protein